MIIRLTKGSDEALERCFAAGVWLVGPLFGHGSLAGEDELGDVGKCDGVAARDALASELPYEIAEEEIDLISGDETVDVGKQLGGEDFGINGGNGSLEAIGVISAEGRAAISLGGTMVLVDQHVAAVAFGANVLAPRIGGGANGSGEIGRHG